MPKNEIPQMAELIDGEVRCQCRLLSFLTYDSEAYVCLLDHSDVIAAIADAGYSFLI